MSTIPALAPETTTGGVRQTLDGFAAKLGGVPNLFRVLANSPAALQSYVALSGATAGGSLNAKQRELVALSVAEANSCDYCLAAHAAIGGMVGLKPEQIGAARLAKGDNAHDTAVLELAQRIVATRGLVPANELAAFKARGVSDALVLEVLANVVLNIFTNYTNHLAGTEIDFPAAPAAKAA